MPRLPFDDRAAAGRLLATPLAGYGGRSDLVVLALPRGGVPVAAALARELGASLDLLPVRRLPTPGHERLTMGAIAPGGIRVLEQGIIARHGLHAAAVEAVVEQEAGELERREHSYRGSRPLPDLRDHLVICVDDGATTGAKMRAAVAALRREESARIVCALPVAPAAAIEAITAEADEVVCLAVADPATDGGPSWYRGAARLSDENVRELLAGYWGEPAAGCHTGSPPARRRHAG